MFCLRSKITGVMLAAGAALAVLMPATTSAAAVAASCQLDLSKAKMKAVAANNLISTTEMNAGQIPNMITSFTPGAPGCVVVQFFADAAAATGQSIVIEPLLFAAPAAPTTKDVLIPGVARFTGRGTGAADAIANAMTFVFTGVSAGPHTLKMRWSSANGGQVYLISRSMVLYYLP